VDALKVQAFYTVGQLADATGLSRWTVARELEQAGVMNQHRRGEAGKRGTRRRVWLDDLRLRCPHLWRALLTHTRLAKAAAGIPGT
jgi:hypothetical protein